MYHKYVNKAKKNPLPIFFAVFHTPSQHAQRPAHLWNHAEGDKTREVCEVVREYVGYKYAHASKNKPLPWRALALQVLLLERHSLLAVFIQDVMSETASDRPMSDANSVRRGRREKEREREREREREIKKDIYVYMCVYVNICIKICILTYWAIVQPETIFSSVVQGLLPGSSEHTEHVRWALATARFWILIAK